MVLTFAAPAIIIKNIAGLEKIVFPALFFHTMRFFLAIAFLGQNSRERSGGESILAKETMQAVSETEKQAQQLVRTAKENGEQIISEAASQSSRLIADAVKEARKRADVLRGVARADAEKLRAAAVADTEKETAALRERADSRRLEASQVILKIVLGQP